MPPKPSKPKPSQKNTKTISVKAEDLKLKDLDPKIIEIIIVGCLYNLKEKKQKTQAYEDYVNQWELGMGAEHPEMREALQNKEALRFKRSYQYLAHFLRMKFPLTCRNTTSKDVAFTFLQAGMEQHPLSKKWRERYNKGLDAEDFEVKHGLRAWRKFLNGGKEI
ncbi:MAG: hypothetical protein Q9182_006802 [Xanthomendoza sp. 2 TL-2023]